MDDELNKLLHHLHQEINRIPLVDQTDRELLRDLQGDIQALLERSGENPLQVQASLVQRLESAVTRYEASHSNLTTAISELLECLSNAGL